MTFARVKPANWAVNEKLTSAQMNQLDIDHAIAWADADACTLPVINWKPRSAGPAVILRRACFNPVESRVYALADNATDHLYYTVNFGNDWSGPVAASGGAGALFDIASDPSGNMVAPLTSNNVAEYNQSSTTWTNHGAPFTGSPSSPTVVWSIVGSLWCVTYRNGALGLQAFTSPNRTAWTSRTAGLPATLTGYAGSNNPQMGVDAAGNIVLVLNTASAVDYKGAYSSNGGVTWTAFTIATALNSAVTRPVWSAYDSQWIIAASSGSGTNVFTSPDGVTWTLVYAPATVVQFRQLAVIGRMYAAVDSNGNLYYSTNKGANWSRADMAPFGTTTWLWALSNGLVFFEEGGPNVVISNRIGQPGIAVT